jgi:polyhydroxyalkanoate synthesis regulator phasin
MEELQSTEILEREILEDARKKALRILKNADDTIRTKTSEWEKKTSQTIDELEENYNKQKEAAEEKVMARLPVDKLRCKVEKIENLLLSAVETWYNSISRQRILELLADDFSKRFALCEEILTSAKKNVYHSGIEHKEAETILKNIKANFTINEAQAAGHYPYITLETDKVRIISSIQKIINYYLQEKRAELIEALTGKAFTEDN